MSWASARTSTKVEDRAYSLLGLMGVSIPVVYGEGTNAFQRLQDEILRTGSDDTIFAFYAIGETHNIGPFETTSLLAKSPDCFRGCGKIIAYNEHVSSGYQTATKEVNFRQRVIGKAEGSASKRIESSIRSSAIANIFRDLFDSLSGDRQGNGSFAHMRPRQVILRCCIENEPEKTVALKLRSIDHRRPDVFAVDVEDDSRLNILVTDVHGYDFCPYKTFSVLRDPGHDAFERNARDNGCTNLVCILGADMEVELISTSAPGTWNPERHCFLLPLEEDELIPYFEAELELRIGHDATLGKPISLERWVVSIEDVEERVSAAVDSIDSLLLIDVRYETLHQHKDSKVTTLIHHTTRFANSMLCR
ncbi:hypothetical protein Slin14017_G104080 [Septoria linicola]|nr:hypothetical protein Slin14017_G104080 [Septoria linicola]